MKLSGTCEVLKYRIGNNFWFAIQLTIGVLGLILFAACRLPSGLWLDETLTAWIIREDFLTTFSRALYFQGQSPFYYLLIYGWTRIFGATEVALRLFSIYNFVLGCAFLYLIHRRSFSRELSMLGTIFGGALLLAYVPVLDARPYGLVTACLISSYYFFFVWRDTGHRGARALHIVCSVATIYTHWLFGTLLIVQTLLVFDAKISQKKHYLRKWISNLFIIGVLSSPNAYQLALIFQKRFTYNCLPSPGAFRWAIITFPMGAILLSLLPILLIAYQHSKLSRVRRFFSPIFIGASWIIVPPTILFILSYFFNVSVLSPRYAGLSYAGFGLIIVSIFSCLSESSGRSFMMLFTSISGILILFALPHNSESWREPAAFLLKLQNKNHRPVLLSSGLIETNSREWILDSTKRAYFSAPIQYYLPNENPVPLPLANDLGLLENVLEKSDTMNVLRQKGFFLVVREKIILDDNYMIISREIFKRYFLDHGFLVSIEKIFPRISVLEFVPNKKAGLNLD
jgi:hypothetical protein